MLAVFLDLETTGLDPRKHRVIEIALRIYNVEHHHEVASYQTVVKQSEQAWVDRNPESVGINGFTWEEVVKGKPVERVGEEVIALFEEVGMVRGHGVFICQNPAFDRGFFSQIIDVDTHEKLNWPYHWLDLASMYWLTKLQEARRGKTPFPTERDLSKDQIADAYSIPPEDKPHRAMNGVDHLIRCYEAVLDTSVTV